MDFLKEVKCSICGSKKKTVTMSSRVAFIMPKSYDLNDEIVRSENLRIHTHQLECKECGNVYIVDELDGVVIFTGK